MHPLTGLLPESDSQSSVVDKRKWSVQQ